MKATACPSRAFQEIIGITGVTSVPRTPAYVRGVINLRGKVIPVIDLAECLGMASQEDTERTCIVVMEISQEGQHQSAGFVVDCVREVQEFGDGQVEPLPSVGQRINMSGITGVAKAGEEILSLLNLEALLAGRTDAFLAGSEV